jgi:hypothetical protein
MSLESTLQRISLIQSAFAPPAAGASAATGPGAGPLAAGSSGGTFAAALASAQAPGATTGGTAATALPAKAIARMTPGQERFAAQLAAMTGLDAGVISAWMLGEMNGAPAAGRERDNNHNWLNIGWTDRGRYGTTASVWSDPVSAANATAGWLRGQKTIPGYGRAVPGIQAILQTAGQSPGAQIAALQRSGWASSGYSILPAVYRSILG